MSETSDLMEKLKQGDRRPEALELVAKVKAAMPALEALLEKVEDHWGSEDLTYRFWHQSFKSYRLQDLTIEIVAALERLAPKMDRDPWKHYPGRRKVRPLLHPWFMEIVRGGTGRRFKLSDNRKWCKVVRPMLEAFWNARYFLQMAVKYGKSLGETPPSLLPSGWAALLSLYGLR